MEKQIKNKSDYPDAVWMEPPKLIGTVGANDLYLLGYEYPEAEEAADAALVAVDYPGRDYLVPTELYGLLGQSEPVQIEKL